MRYYPVNLDITHRNCLVVGGGAVGARKVKTLIRCNATVTVVSLTFDPRLLEMAQDHGIRLLKRAYRTSDLEGMFLVIGATNDTVLNKTIRRDAEKKNMLCNIVDFPEACNFILPAIVSQGDLLIAISTCGKSPAFAKKLRQSLELEFGPEYAQFLNLMGAIRERLLKEAHAPDAHKHVFDQLIAGGLLEMIKNGNRPQINMLLHQTLGRHYSLEDLLPVEK